ncbi:acyl-CoA thioesterase domain-containing protein [Mycobacterium sp. ACS4331]|uniref:acyl-CoA thioesterase n=1 Tax=Mycobacterium sp. ACS4331 TaxID=1834121 RepID=UPI0007FD4D5F|nr:acyl-CoA thioesterase domain-containing protein [Mycobacterium sp. ACS4331]OBF25393.1 acyl-CoA thioesterase II [Mycobacterium sp. ACS4331]
MSALLDVLALRDAGSDVWVGFGHGPAGKRAYGGQFLAQSLAAAARTVDDAGALPTSLHLTFLRGGDPTEPTDYEVERTYDGRTAKTRRVVARQAGRVMTTATVSFSRAMDGPEHGHIEQLPQDPEGLEPTGPAGPAPGLPLDELDIRVSDSGEGQDFLRRLWWRTTVPVPDDALTHACLALFVTDVYMIDPALRVHGHTMRDRTHRSGTTDASVWFHRPLRADRWNLLESRSPAGARGRGVVTASLIGDDGDVCATLVQEGVIAARDPENSPTPTK